jgi:hypothetical protein
LTSRALKVLLSHTHGGTAALFEALVDLGIEAIRTGEERITPEMVSDYVDPPVPA